MKKVLIILLVGFSIVGCKSKEEKFDESAAYDSSSLVYSDLENKKYTTIQEDLENSGFSLSISTSGKVNRTIDLSRKNGGFFLLSVQFKYSSVDKIFLGLSEIYVYIPALKTLYSNYIEEVEADISIYENALNEIGLSESELIDFAIWYFEQNKYTLDDKWHQKVWQNVVINNADLSAKNKKGKAL